MAKMARRSYLQLSPGMQSTRPVRDWLGRLLTPTSLESRLSDAQLVLAEVVNNAILHAPGAPVEIEAIVEDTRLEVSVRDRSREHPAPRDPAPDDVSGRGLIIVDALADEWGVTDAPAGKCVWFRLREAS